jgi:hypothetical protein
MHRSKRKTAILVLIFAAALFVLIAQLSASDHNQSRFKLEGAWIARTTFVDIPGFSETSFQWNYVLAPDPSGRRATIRGSVDVAFPQIIAYDFLSPLIGEAVMTGPNTAAFDSIWYAIQKGIPIDGIAFIGRAWGEIRFVGAGKSEVTYNFEIYSPDADADGDGLPEGDWELSFTATSLDTRLPSPIP